MGASFAGTLAQVQSATDTETRAGATASYFTLAYLAVILCTVGVGLVSSTAGLRQAAVVFTGLVLAVVGAALVARRRRSHAG